MKEYMSASIKATKIIKVSAMVVITLTVMIITAIMPDTAKCDNEGLIDAYNSPSGGTIVTCDNNHIITNNVDEDTYEVFAK